MMSLPEKNDILKTIRSDALKAAAQASAKTEADMVFGEGDPDAEIISLKIMLFPLYHPASVIYNPPLKAVYAEDLRKLKDYILAI